MDHPGHREIGGIERSPANLVRGHRRGGAPPPRRHAGDCGVRRREDARLRASPRRGCSRIPCSGTDCCPEPSRSARGSALDCGRAAPWRPSASRARRTRTGPHRLRGTPPAIREAGRPCRVPRRSGPTCRSRAGGNTTGAGRSAVKRHHAGAACAIVAALLRAGEAEIVTQYSEQRPVGIHLERARGAVDLRASGRSLRIALAQRPPRRFR